MKLHLIPLLAAFLAPLSARADELTVQLRGPVRAESAGFVWAQAHGLYAAEGLEVTLLPADEAPPFESLARGAADLTVEWLPTALVAREHGLPVVNVAQIMAKPALRLTCLAESGVKTAADLRGRTVASSFRGTEYPLRVWLNRLGLTVDDSLDGVSLLGQWPGPSGAAEMLRQRQTACAGTLSYDRLPGAGLVVLDPATQGAATLEDGLYALPPGLTDRDRLARFIRASMAGWHQAVAEPEAAARLVLGPDPDPQLLRHQAAMIAGIGPLLSPDGRLDPQAYAASVEALRAGGAAALLAQEPQSAALDVVPPPAPPAAEQPRPTP